MSPTDHVRAALDTVDHAHLLTREQEHFLARVIRIGKRRPSWAGLGKFAREILVSHNLYLAVSIASRYLSKSSLEDLIQEANRGLLEAANRFDHRYRLRFSSYATHWIKKYVLEYIYNDSLIRLPQAAWFRSGKRRLKCLASLPNPPMACSVDLADLDICPWPALDEDAIISCVTAANTVGSLWSVLSPLEAKVLSLRFGIGVPTVSSSQDIAKGIGRKRGMVYKIEKRALGKMRDLLFHIESISYGSLSNVA